MTNFAKDQLGVEPQNSRAAAKKSRESVFLPNRQSPKQRMKIDWMIEDFDSFHAAYLRKLSFGRLPKRAAQYDCAAFDLEETREYVGGDGHKFTGANLAGVAAYIVRCAKDPIDFLHSLKHVPSQMIEPLKTYIRVKLALGRLNAQIEKTKKQGVAPAPDLTIDDPAKREVSETIAPARGIAFHSPVSIDQGRKPKPKSPPKFKWHTSPVKSYGFKEMRAAYGYDPRDTSVYWIEKRADALRRRWKARANTSAGQGREPAKLRPKGVEPSIGEPHAPPILKYFEPVDADYNAVWPPVELPGGPPQNSTPDDLESWDARVSADYDSQDLAAIAPLRVLERSTSITPLFSELKFAAVEARSELGHTRSMSLLTKILTAGARIFGPPPQIDLDGEPGQIEPAGVTAALIALGAKMAKSDGVVTPDEVEAFKRVFQATPENDAAIGRFFDLARQTTLGFERYAEIVAKKYRAQPAALEDVLDGLFHIALADGVVTNAERHFLQRVGEIFGFSDLEFKRIQVAHMGRASDDPYLILGIEESVTDSELKRAYRRMAGANHPDRMTARGLPKELIGLANHKMAMINKAYDEIKQQRKAVLPKLHGPAT